MCECGRRREQEGAEREKEGALALSYTLPALPLPPTLQKGEDMGEGLPAQGVKDRQTDRQTVDRTGRANGKDEKEKNR